MPTSTTETKTTARTRTWPRSRLVGMTLDEERAGRFTSTSWFGVAAPPWLALLVATGIDRRGERLAAWSRDLRCFAGRRLEEQLSLRRGCPRRGSGGRVRRVLVGVLCGVLGAACAATSGTS